MSVLTPEKATIQGNEYVIGRLDLYEALNVSRLVAPILPIIFHDLIGEIAKCIQNSADDETATLDQRLTEIGFLITTCEPVLREIASMPEKDFKTVIQTCLSAIDRKGPKGYYRIMQNGTLVADDIDQGTAMVLVFRVLVRELRPIGSALKI